MQMADVIASGSNGAPDEPTRLSEYRDDGYYADATILTRSGAIPLDGRKTGLNNNLIVFGSPGSGKSRNVIGPNIMNCASSFVVIDPKGALYEELGPGLAESGYEVELLDFKRPERSTVHWSPFDFMRSDQDRYAICESIVCAHGRGSAEPFWDMCGIQLLEAIVELASPAAAPRSPHGTACLSHVLNYARKLYLPSPRPWAAEGEVEARCELDDVFFDLRSKHRRAYELWQMVRTSAERTFRSVKVTLNANLQPLNHEGLVELMDGLGPRLSPPSLADGRHALFISISDTDRSLDFLAKLCVGQLVNELTRFADDECEGALPSHVRFVLDDFAAMGRFDGVPSWVNSLRSRNIGITMVCQSVAQLYGVYGQEAEGLIAACDQCMFVGAQNDPETRRYIGRRAGVDGYASTWNGTAWVFVRGCQPHVGLLYEPERHPLYPRFELARDCARGLPAWATMTRREQRERFEDEW